MRIGSLMPSGTPWKEAFTALASRFPAVEFITDPDRTRAELSEIDALVAGRISEADLGAAPALTALFLPITGVNHLPATALAARGVRVFNVHANAESVAQCALSMTLAFYGRTIEFHDDLRLAKWHGIWVGGGPEDEWRSLFGRRCAIFGMGAIGTALARLLKAFDCEVVGWRRRRDAPTPPDFDRVEPDFATAVQGAELLFAALPLTPETRGLFSREILLGARGKFLVNVGRGELVDEEGLWLSLRDGVLKGAAIDTWYVYPKGGTIGAPSRFPIHELPNVILSPHVGGSTVEAGEAAALQVVENIASWLDSGSCRREVDLRLLY